jgi:2-methylaconitate cis-trans-isomerase PrpF
MEESVQTTAPIADAAPLDAERTASAGPSHASQASTPRSGIDAVSEQVRVPVLIMRGGSSKAVFLREQDVPAEEDARTRLLLALFGSPDRRQIDGLGGADLLTSKCAIMGPPTRDDADIDYTFAQVSVEQPIVSYDISCGNISAAAGLYALEEGFVRAVAPVTTVRVHNTNTGTILRIRLPVHQGVARIEGDCRIDAVPGTGAEIGMDFALTAGAATGRLLPTGSPRNRIEVAGVPHPFDVSIVDIENICVFVSAEHLGLAGSEGPADLPTSAYAILERIRVEAARLAGIDSYLLPFQVIVSRPAPSRDFVTGRLVEANEVDVTARLVVEGGMHKAYAGTGATCLGVAARITGSVVHDVCRPRGAREQIRIGHPSGVMPILADVTPVKGGWSVEEASFARTARRLLEGSAWVLRARL